MKKKLLTILSLGLSSVMMAQTFVSTTAENKNVVLEEFTGIYCVNCPDGHLQATQIHDQNPGDVVLINIHTGSYANPNAGDPDFQTPFGNLIAGQSNLSGYPAATVNRHVFPGLEMNAGGTAMSRTNGNWFTAAAQILTEPSCVNVAAEATLDISTRELTVIVEAYYTGSSTSTTNKINVVLLQNNIEGPQTGGNLNPTQMLPNGNYNHQHMLRHLLTGQWGDNVTTTATGSFFQNTYTYTIPTDLNGVVYDLFNLEVAVFVVEGQQEILSGNMGNITHIVPPGVNLIDLSAATNMTMPTSLCDNNITPEITVTNNSAMAVDTFEVSYTLNQNTPVTQTVYTALAAFGANTTITFPTITIPSGENTISYSSGTLAGTSFIDNIPNNNLASSGSFNTISPTAFAIDHSEGFEGYTNQTPAPNNALLLNPQGHRVFIIDATWPGPNSGGYGLSNNSFRWSFIDQTMGSGDYADLVFEKLDFSSSTGNGITYSYAHAQSTGSDNNRLQVLVSTDCGTTWNLESERIGTSLATTTPVPTSTPFYPTSTTWATDIVDLSIYDGNADVMIAFKGICEGGNNLYIDDIKIDEITPSWNCDPVNGCVDPGTGIGDYSALATCNAACNTNSIEESNTLSFNLYPNPVKDRLVIEGQYTSTNIYDVFGKVVLTTDYQNTIDVTALSSGVYFINITKGDETFIKKITIAK
jgi:hypothetical protein